VKYLHEYRDAGLVRQLLRMIEQTVRGRWSIMEVCGGQTHSIIKHGIDQQLPSGLTLLHGPGCPVCVTPSATVDRAIEIAGDQRVIFTTFGDMLRVPGSRGDLMTARARGADVRMLYSPFEAVRLAVANPEREVVFFAIGFETTAPVVASAILQAQQQRLTNFSILAAQVRIPPAMAVILESLPCKVDAFLAPGHVCAVTGIEEYRELTERYHVPIVITGFEPVDIIQGIRAAVLQLERRAAFVQIPYSRVVRVSGNELAKQRMAQVYRTVDRQWRGLGTIPQSGYALRDEFAAFDAERRFQLSISDGPMTDLNCGQVLTGVIKPAQCPHFATDCTPDSPVGPPMVSSEGVCAAYYRYAQRGEKPATSHGS